MGQNIILVGIPSVVRGGACQLPYPQLIKMLLFDMYVRSAPAILHGLICRQNCSIMSLHSILSKAHFISMET